MMAPGQRIFADINRCCWNKNQFCSLFLQKNKSEKEWWARQMRNRSLKGMRLRSKSPSWDPCMVSLPLSSLTGIEFVFRKSREKKRTRNADAQTARWRAAVLRLCGLHAGQGRERQSAHEEERGGQQSTRPQSNRGSFPARAYWQD